MSENTSFPLEKVKCIDQETRDIVFGFLKEAQESLLPSNSNYHNIAINIQHICLLYFRDGIDSKILTVKETNTFFDLLHENNKFLSRKYSYFRLIHRFSTTSSDSENKLNYESFIKYCFDKKNLLILIHTDTNNIFGGFTSIGWNSNDKDIETTKYYKDKKAFMFLIRSNFGYKPYLANIRFGYQKFAIAINKPFYCIFGSGWDLYLTDKQDGNVYASSTYQWPKYYDGTNKKIKNGCYLNGPQSQHFNIKAMEVFQLK